MMTQPSEEGIGQRLRRRAATSIEYLFCISLILCVCIVAVQRIGVWLKKSATETANVLQKEL